LGGRREDMIETRSKIKERLTLSMVNDTARCDADEPVISYVGIEGRSWTRERKED
jgi:hypothetical protein